MNQAPMAKSKKPLPAKESNSTTKNSPDGINGIRGINNTTTGKDMTWVDPMHVRFQHSKIRPVFSSCGRTLMETLNSIRNNEITPAHLPPIQVLIGPESDDGKHRWYFSLNNRRLYVLKRCREEGLLKGTNNLILVRVREPKSQSEIERYTVSNCAVEAKIVPEKRAKEKRIHGDNAGSCHESNVNTIAGYRVKPDDDGDNNSNDDDDDSDDGDSDRGGDDDDDDDDDATDGSDSGCDAKKSKYSNRFNALI